MKVLIIDVSTMKGFVKHRWVGDAGVGGGRSSYGLVPNFSEVCKFFVGADKWTIGVMRCDGIRAI